MSDKKERVHMSGHIIGKLTVEVQFYDIISISKFYWKYLIARSIQQSTLISIKKVEIKLM